jgi:hypothetical protein
VAAVDVGSLCSMDKRHACTFRPSRNALRPDRHGFQVCFFCSAFLSIALTASPKTPARPSRLLLKTTSTGEGWRLGCFVKGDGQKTHSRAEKKDHENKYKKHSRAREQIRTVEQ